VRSGDGVLRLDGSLDFRDERVPVTLGLRGDDVTIASTAELFVVADPDLQLRWLPDALEVRGSLAVDEARADLESLDSSVEVSPDVVVVDAAATPTTRERPLDLEVAVRLGDDVRLIGFGLDGRMRGEVTFRQAPGRRATGRGTLDVDGTYRAYGQSLTIERARLGYAGGRPFDDPTLDIQADREFDEVRVGVRVRGTARRPETSIVSNPAMDTSEALSWLVLGRPLSTTTGGESRQIGAAALALGAGGNLVAQQIGAKLGLDEAGVVDSRNLGGATFTVGKYVSPRLFLSYGVSLIGTGQVLTLKYLLTRGFDISVESGNENAASVNWRIER
jgi:translocation and assembly module TamB